MTTAQTLRAVLDVLETALGETRPGGALVDTFERFDGDATDAVEEHVAELHSPSGASVLVGFLTDEPGFEDEARRPLTFALRPSVLVVRRRGARQHRDAETIRNWTRDAEALDDLYDAAALALAQSPLGVRVRRGVALASDTRDWTGRALVVELERSFPPGLAPSPYA